MIKIAVVYNLHRYGGGADAVAKDTVDYLRQSDDVEVVVYEEDSKVLKGITGAVRAFLTPIIPFSWRRFNNFLKKEKPHIIHAHELYPLVTPWILSICKKRRVPVVLTCHDYRMSCPIATHYRSEKVCFRCVEKNEFSCVLYNCTGSFLKSISYALRNCIAKQFRLYVDNVNLYLTPSEITKALLCEHASLDPKQVYVVNNPVPFVDKVNDLEWVKGDYIAYAGRNSPEKGFSSVVDACLTLGLPLHVAGNFSEYVEDKTNVSTGIKFMGCLSRHEMVEFYRNARLTVVPSTWHETFGLVVAESLSCKTPVVVSNMGALSEVAGAGGVIFSNGDNTELVNAIESLWENPDRCFSLAKQGAMHVASYSSQNYVSKLINIYKTLINENSTNRV